MVLLKNSLIFIWQNQIRNEFVNGRIIYERQLQAMFYFYLRTLLPGEYVIWVEPVVEINNIENYNKVKPDLIITKNSQVIAIIELKFKPWESINNYVPDIRKLCLFEEIASTNLKLDLSVKPNSPNWNVQKLNKGNSSFTLIEDHLSVFVAFYHPDDKYTPNLDSVTKRPKNFLYLKGHFTGPDDVILEYEN